MSDAVTARVRCTICGGETFRDVLEAGALRGFKAVGKLDIDVCT